MIVNCNFIIGICATVIALNWLGMLAAFRARRSYSFGLPFVCGILAALAITVHPIPGLFKFAFVPIVLDPSILVALYSMLFAPKQ